MKEFPRVSVIVNNFKDTKHLELCLNSLLKSEYKNLEIIVVDFCTPNFEKWIKKFPVDKYLHFDSDLGLAKQRNIGFQNADKSSQYICFLDDDVFVTPEWLTKIIEQL